MPFYSIADQFDMTPENEKYYECDYINCEIYFHSRNPRHSEDWVKDLFNYNWHLIYNHLHLIVTHILCDKHCRDVSKSLKYIDIRCWKC